LHQQLLSAGISVDSAGAGEIQANPFLKVYGGTRQIATVNYKHQDQRDANAVAMVPSSVTNQLHAGGDAGAALAKNSCQQRGVQSQTFQMARLMRRPAAVVVVVPEAGEKVPHKKAEIESSRRNASSIVRCRRLTTERIDREKSIHNAEHNTCLHRCAVRVPVNAHFDSRRSRIFEAVLAEFFDVGAVHSVDAHGDKLVGLIFRCNPRFISFTNSGLTP